MNILSFAKLGITVISGLILSMGSVGNYTTSPVTAEENLEGKGCAANFENQGLIPFYYDGPMPASKADIENIDNWKRGSNPELDCDNVDSQPCGLLVVPLYVDETDPLNHKLHSSINLSAKEQNNDEDPTYLETVDGEDNLIFNRSI